MYYTVYKVTNKVNGKFYIGTHKTKNLDDNYYGSGKLLKRAIQKYGIENFEKEILFVFDNPEDMFAKEAEIVTEDFLAEENTYNLKVGGFGGWDYINESGLGRQAAKKGALESSRTQRKLWKENAEWATKQRQQRSEHFKNLRLKGKVPAPRPHNIGEYKHSKEVREKISKARQGKGVAENNAFYGTRWIHSLEKKESKRIDKNMPLPEGWVEGRKIKFLSK